MNLIFGGGYQTNLYYYQQYKHLIKNHYYTKKNRKKTDKVHYSHCPFAKKRKERIFQGSSLSKSHHFVDEISSFALKENKSHFYPHKKQKKTIYPKQIYFQYTFNIQDFHSIHTFKLVNYEIMVDKKNRLKCCLLTQCL